jgi:glycosyltransferase involved in cell wall biosynthesis
MIETSIIIRTRNEEKWLGRVLEALFGQTYKNFEVILVDSESSDRTLEIAKKFPVKIFNILQKDFSYPHALNYGIEKTKPTLPDFELDFY